MQPPRGYRGIDHQALGSDIVAVDRALETLAPSRMMRRALLGAETLEWLKTVEPQGWYPIGQLLDLLERVGDRSGRFALIKVGRLIFEQVQQGLRAEDFTAYSLLDGMDHLYRHNNRGTDIGGWRITEFTYHHALVEKTTPHHCAMEEGILAQALGFIGAPSVVTQVACRRDRGDHCLFQVAPITSNDRWGERPRSPFSAEAATGARTG